MVSWSIPECYGQDLKSKVPLNSAGFTYHLAATPVVMPELAECVGPALHPMNNSVFSSEAGIELECHLPKSQDD